MNNEIQDGTQHNYQSWSENKWEMKFSILRVLAQNEKARNVHIRI